METKPEMTKAELWRQLESMQAKMDAAIAERDTALARVVELEAALMTALDDRLDGIARELQAAYAAKRRAA